jgi:hypothetical protein
MGFLDVFPVGPAPGHPLTTAPRPKADGDGARDRDPHHRHRELSIG